MPIDTSIYANIKQPQQYSLGDIMGLATSAQNLQTGKIAQERQDVALEQERGSLNARKAVRDVMANPQYRDPETGLLDLNKLAPAIQAADPNNYVWHDALQKTAQVNGDVMKLKSEAMNLSDQQQAYVGQRIGAVVADPKSTRKDLNTTLDDVMKAMPSVKPQVDIIRSHVGGIDAQAGDDWRHVATMFRNQAFPLADQKPQTVMVNTGPANVPMQGNSLNGPVGPMAGATSVPNQVPPTQAQTTRTDVLGNPYLEERAPDGRVTPKPMPGASMPPVLSFPQGESAQSAEQLTALRNRANQAASTVAQQKFNNMQIIKLADETNTGVAAQYAANLKGQAAGIPWTTNSADNYGRLMHYLALQSQANAQAMGAGTDAARETSQQATASSSWTKEAIKSATKVNDALATGVELYNRGLEAAINSPNNPKGIFAARDFQNEWSKTFDVNAMRLQNAMERGDTKEQEAVIRSVGGRGSAGAKALATKMRALDALISGGTAR